MSIKGYLLILLVLHSLSMPGCRNFLHQKRTDRTLAAMKTGTADERVTALAGIKDRPSPHLRESLEKLLEEDSNAVVRALSAEALGNLAAPESIAVLRARLRRDTDQYVRKAALTALAVIKKQEVRADINHTMQTDDSALVRITALDLGVNLLDRQMQYEMLRDAIGDQSEVVRLAAYHHLKELTGWDMPPDASSRWREKLLQSEHIN